MRARVRVIITGKLHTLAPVFRNKISESEQDFGIIYLQKFPIIWYLCSYNNH